MGYQPNIAKVKETGNGKYQNQIRIAEHSLIASEPAVLGGDDSGPTPMELLCGSLGACTTITLRMYADRKGWPMEGILVDVSHKRGQLEDCPNGGKPRPQDIFTKTISILGPLSEEQKKRLLMIAAKCPVHRVLENSACMRTISSE